MYRRIVELPARTTPTQFPIQSSACPHATVRELLINSRSKELPGVVVWLTWPTLLNSAQYLPGLCITASPQMAPLESAGPHTLCFVTTRPPSERATFLCPSVNCAHEFSRSVPCDFNKLLVVYLIVPARQAAQPRAGRRAAEGIAGPPTSSRCTSKRTPAPPRRGSPSPPHDRSSLHCLHPPIGESLCQKKT